MDDHARNQPFPQAHSTGRRLHWCANREGT